MNEEQDRKIEISFEITREDSTGNGNYEQVYLTFSVSDLQKEWISQGYKEPEYFAGVWEQKGNDPCRYNYYDLKMEQSLVDAEKGMEK